jgi:hypothetical protein
MVTLESSKGQTSVVESVQGWEVPRAGSMNYRVGKRARASEGEMVPVKGKRSWKECHKKQGGRGKGDRKGTE